MADSLVENLRAALRGNRLATRLFFDRRYLQVDPYGLRRAKEVYRVERALGLLDDLAADRALEIGCGEGRWSGRIAALARQLLAIDISDTAIWRARWANRHDPRITFRRADLLTADLQPAGFDLVFCSEVLYYIQRRQLEAVVDKTLHLMRLEGTLLLLHHRSPHDDDAGRLGKAFGARTIHEAFSTRPEFLIEADVLDPHYRITRLRRLS